MVQAVILAAGRSTRTYPLTLTRPKPLLKAANKTILEHNLDQLSGLVDEVILIVGYKAKMIRQIIGDSYMGLKIKCVIQKEQRGTGHAVMQAKSLLKDRFLVMNGDDFFSAKDIKRCIKHDYCVLAKEVPDPQNFGVFVLDGNRVIKLVEKPKKKISNLANTGLYVFRKEVFQIKIKESERGEYEITDYVKALIKDRKVHCEKVKDFWFPIVYPWSLLEANAYFVENIKESFKGQIEKNVIIKGKIKVGKGTRILSGTYIKGNVIIGENCKIGPNCYLRGNTSIGNNCHIGQAVEIKNTIIGNNSNVPHLSYIGDSVIGENVNLGAGTITANLRHDNANVKSPVKGDLIDSGRRKLGAIVADHVHTGINTSIYPGRKIWPHKMTLPGQVVTRDIK